MNGNEERMNDYLDGIDRDGRTVSLGDVRQAFDTLLEVVGRECDRETTMAVYWAAEDVISILTGEWKPEQVK